MSNFKNFTNYYNRKGQGYIPPSAGSFGSGTKKAIKHFTDLDVYQKSLEASVFISKQEQKEKGAH